MERRRGAERFTFTMMQSSGTTAGEVACTTPCPPRARWQEYPRIITVTYGQTIKISAGHGISRWQAGSDTDFPS